MKRKFNRHTFQNITRFFNTEDFERRVDQVSARRKRMWISNPPVWNLHRENRTPDVNYAPQISSRLPEQTGRLVSSKPVIFVRLGRLEGPKRVWLRIIPSPERCVPCPLLFRFAQRSIFQWKWNEDYRVRFNKTFHFVHRCQFWTATLYTGGKILERFLRSARFNRVKSLEKNCDRIGTLIDFINYLFFLLPFFFFRIERILLFEVWIEIKMLQTNESVCIWYKSIDLNL